MTSTTRASVSSVRHGTDLRTGNASVQSIEIAPERGLRFERELPGGHRRDERGERLEESRGHAVVALGQHDLRERAGDRLRRRQSPAGEVIGLAKKAQTPNRGTLVRASHGRAAGAIERRRAGLPASRAGTERDRLVVEHEPVAREAGDGGLATARGPGEDPRASVVDDGGRVEEDPTLLHQEEAAQEAE